MGYEWTTSMSYIPQQARYWEVPGLGEDRASREQTGEAQREKSTQIRTQLGRAEEADLDKRD